MTKRGSIRLTGSSKNLVDTPPEPVEQLVRYLDPRDPISEPCAGSGALCDLLEGRMKPIDHARQFTTMGIPVFPVRVQKIGNKWQKFPLTLHGHMDASLYIDAHDWEGGCNAVGLRMGKGWYALDVDDATEGSPATEWIRQYVPNYKETRAHRTPSGGYHILYRLPAGWHDLGGRQKIVQDLDSRGAGGWIAFGDMYEVVADKEPLTLSTRVCEIVHAGSSNVKDVPVGEYTPPGNETEVNERLLHLVETNWRINARWRGVSLGMQDQTRSAHDMSLSWHLAAFGFGTDEIAYVLLNLYEHGQARFLARGGERAAMRCAVRASASVDQARDEMTGSESVNDIRAEDIAAMDEIIANLREAE
ncbi:bifunctional DNA primase/polymerase [Tropicimonas sp. IMCC6043]|uniref:bifunctional DNA primase/polymerase n=1 Tax=Tropicimonas sp. IMCC6043 TaxID=2510645 RepID=UPI00101C6B1A|nr:bifunctional DNA primase/polymerase [Tropicimonas sp. IMCC6043]RYH06115.1 hypothetical protein EU800_24935 [Tropicimonas sp. IMCC6043]